MSIRDIILNAKDCPTHSITVPEWDNVTVYVPVLTVEELENFQKLNDKDDKSTRLLVRVLRDENGKQVFTDEDVPLKAKSFAAVSRVLAFFNEKNNLDDEAVEQAKND